MSSAELCCEWVELSLARPFDFEDLFSAPGDRVQGCFSVVVAVAVGSAGASRPWAVALVVVLVGVGPPVVGGHWRRVRGSVVRPTTAAVASSSMEGKVALARTVCGGGAAGAVGVGAGAGDGVGAGAGAGAGLWCCACCDCRCRRPPSVAVPAAGGCVGAVAAVIVRMASSALPLSAKSCAIASRINDDIRGFDEFLNRWMLSESPLPSP